MAGFYENAGDPGNQFGDSAKASATESKHWANYPEDSPVPEGDGSEFSSEHHANKASADAASTAADRVQTGLDATSTSADTSATAADRVQTGLDVTATNADVVSTNADVLLTNADVVSTNADVVTTTQDAIDTAADAVATAADRVQTGLDVTSSGTNATNAATSASNAATSETNAAASAASITNDISASRNTVLNQDPVSQGQSQRVGFSATTYTGNGTSQSVSTGMDMSTGDLGGLVWVKGRSGATAHRLFDTIRGDLGRLASDSTAAETIAAGSVSITSGGFDVGSNVDVNTNTATYVSWSFQTTHKDTGVTNHNKAYTAHYNAPLGFSIVGYEGDGVDGHEIPHFLGKEPELSIYKNRDTVIPWRVQGTLVGDASSGDYLVLDDTAAIANASASVSVITDTTVSLGSAATQNDNADNYISYHFTSIPGVSKVGKYIGTGTAGNYVDCGFKPAFVLVKNLTSAFSWVIVDSARGDAELFPNLSNAETAFDRLDFVDGGFVLVEGSLSSNGLNDEYLFLAFADTNATTGRTDYDYPTTEDTLSINTDTIISSANGFDANGELNTQFQFGSGVTQVLGAGFENKKLWLYTDSAGTLGTTELRPLEGITRNDADKWGEASPLDASLRTTARHFDYESETGVALASAEVATFESWHAFDKNQTPGTFTYWQVASTTTSSLQYKQTEARVLKSWRIRSIAATQDPRLFTIEGSNDGLNWVAVDSTYTASDYTGNGSDLWGDIQDTSGNTTAYLYHRVNITANNGHGTNTAIRELEFNTVLPSDYYLVGEGKMFNDAGTRIDRVYLAEILTGADGEVSSFTNLPVAKRKAVDADFQGDVTVHGELKNRLVASAWALVDETQNPPLILASEGIADVVDVGGTEVHYIVDSSIDLNKASVEAGATTVLESKNRFSISSAGISRRSIQIFGGKEIV